MERPRSNSNTRTEDLFTPLALRYAPFLNPLDASDTAADPDGDRLSTLDETIKFHTNPWKADTDGHGWNDNLEIEVGKDPLDPNSRPETLIVATPMVEVSIPRDGLSAGVIAAGPLIELTLPKNVDMGCGGATAPLDVKRCFIRAPFLTRSCPSTVTYARFKIPPDVKKDVRYDGRVQCSTTTHIARQH